MRHASGVHPTHLPGANTGGGAVLDVNDGIGLDVLGHLGRQLQIHQLLFGRLALCNDLEGTIIDIAIVATLDQQAAGYRFYRQTVGLGVGDTAGQQQAQILLGGDDLLRFWRRRGGDDHLGEHLDDFGGSFGVDFAIGGDNAAKGRDRISPQSLEIGGFKIIGHSHTAGIGMLDDGDRSGLGRIELRNQLEGGVGIVDIVVAQGLALYLGGGGNARALLAGLVECGPLVGVFAIAHDFA